MKRTTLERILSLCAIVIFGLTGAATAQLQPQSARINAEYLPINGYQNFNVASNSPTANDCSSVNGQLPSTFQGLPVIYVNPDPSIGTDQAGYGSHAHPYRSLQYASANVMGGQLVCAESGTYAHFNVTTSGTDYNHITRFEVVPGNTAEIDLTSQVDTSLNGIGIGHSQYDEQHEVVYYYPIHYVLVSGFYIHGPDDAIRAQGDSGLSAAMASGGADYYNANCIELHGNSTIDTLYVTGGKADHIYIIGNHAEGCPGSGIATEFADYVTIDDNTINNCSWYTIFGTSGINMADDVDLEDADHPKDPNAKLYTEYITNNTLYNNYEFVPYGPTNSLSDGEGIIIDTNLNADYRQDFGNPYYNNVEHVGRYHGYTLVENNVVYSNGSGGIEVLASENVDVMYNTLFNNDLNYRECYTVAAPACYEGDQGRGEVDISDSINVTIGDNILYSSIYDRPIRLTVSPAILGETYVNTDLLTPTTFQNLGYNPWAEGNDWQDGYQPTGSKDFNNKGGNPNFISGYVWANDFNPPHSFATGQIATDLNSVDLHLQSSSTSGIYNGYNYLMLDHDRDGVPRTGTYQMYPVGAYFIP